MPGPIDYVSGLGKLPDPLGNIQNAIQFKVGLDNARLQQQLGQLKMQQAQQAMDAQAAFKSDMQAYLANPTAEGYARIIANHPEYQKQASEAWRAIDGSKRTSDLTAVGEIATLMRNGSWDEAGKRLERRIAADEAAGQDTSEDRYILDSIRSGDPRRQKEALGLSVFAMGAADPEHAKSFLESMGLSQERRVREVDGILYDDNTGEAIAQSPYPRVIAGPDGSFYQNTPGAGAIPGIPTIGGAAAPSAPAAEPAQTGEPGALSPDDAWKFTLKHEGGYSASDGNGAPVNFGINQGANPDVDVKSLTADGAKKLFVERYWNKSGAANLPAPLAAVHSDTYYINPAKAQQFLEKSGGDWQKYMTMRQNWLGSLSRQPKYERFGKAWSSRNEALREFAGGLSGGSAGPVAVRSKQEYDRLPSGAQYVAPDGSVRIKG